MCDRGRHVPTMKHNLSTSGRSPAHQAPYCGTPLLGRSWGGEARSRSVVGAFENWTVVMAAQRWTFSGPSSPASAMAAFCGVVVKPQ